MKRVIFLLSVIFLLAVPITAAIGVSFPYYKDNPLVLRPSENQILNFTVRAQSDTIITAIVTNDLGNFAKIVGKEEFAIPQGKQSVKIPVQIQIPKNAKSSEQNVSVKFVQLSAAEGMVQFSPAMTFSFPLKIVEELPERAAIGKIPSGERLPKSVIVVLVSAGIISLLLAIAITFLAIRIRRDRQNFKPSYSKY